MSIILLIGWVVLAALGLLALAFIITFVSERELRAAGLMGLLSLPALSLLAALLLSDMAAKSWIVSGIVLGIGVLTLVLLFPTGGPSATRIVGEQQRIDERDAVFHRFYRLTPGTPEFELYYRDHPDKKAFDDEVRALPRLAEPGSQTYDPLTSPFQIATFDVLERMTREIEWDASPIEEKPVDASPEDLTRRVKGFSRYLGAKLVGTTLLNPAYVYSHNARGPGPWGAPITPDHTHAIAIAVEMSYEMIRHAPENATTTETAKEYFEAARIAMLVARYINFLGYEARAHVDANYRVMCVPIAADAGLGELGRLGLLITPKYGPRVRLSVVTTNMPLAEDPRVAHGVQEFCSICRKCALHCPSGSVDGGEKGVYAGVEKWQTTRDTCYRFWRQRGSDCSICVRVCPYSNPSSPVHSAVRWAIRRNPLARRLALWGDGLFYGSRRKPPRPLPEWHATRRSKRRNGERAKGR